MDRRRALLIVAGAFAPVSLVVAQAKPFRIGYLSTRARHDRMDDAFVEAMRARGYVAGRNLAIEYRWAANDPARLQAMADELARMKVDVIVTATTAGTRAAMQATRTIPIVMAATADPVGARLIESLGRPGGNVTGLSLQTTDFAWKRLELVRELVPDATRVGLLVEKVADPSRGTTAQLVFETAAAARRLDVTLVVCEVSRAEGLGEAFDEFRRARMQALIVQVSPLLVEHRGQVTALAARERLPAIYEARNFVDAGGLASYGPDLADSYRRAAGYVDRILKGAKPQELPVEQPDKPELVIHAATARALGLTLVAALLLRADEIVH